MQPIGDLLPRRINKLGIQKPVEAARIIEEANRLADSRFRAIRFSRGILTLRCSSGLIAQEVSFQSHELIELINDKIKRPAIRRISFIIGE